MVNKDSHVI